MKHIRAFSDHPVKTQKILLNNLINVARHTEWGKKYDFNSIKHSGIFASRIPVQDYESLKPYIHRMMLGQKDVLWAGQVNWFSKSSGTTSDKSKFIPVTNENLKHCHLRGGWDSMTLLYNQHPDVKIFSHKNLVMGGAITRFKDYPNSQIGDVSAIMLHKLPLIGRPFYTPDLETALDPDMERKLNNIAAISSKENVAMIGGVPTWVVVLFRKILELTGKSNILEVWPNLQVYMHGGVSFQPYRDQFNALIPKPDFIYQEIYNASEGFFASQDFESEEGMLLLLNNGIYYEFIPFSERHLEQTRAVPLEEVEIGKNYTLVISTNSGLWRYAPGDTVMFTSTKPYRIKVTGRTKQFVNAFGEEVMIENTDAALAETCRQTGAIASEYTVAPIFFKGGGKGGHQWVIEFLKEPENLKSFGNLLDQNLQKVNSDYEAKRFGNLALESLSLVAVPPGSFTNWMRYRGKYGGQNKIPRLANNRLYIDEILRFLEVENV